MAKATHEPHFLSFSLIAVFLIAVLTIFGMVALVSNGPDLSGTPLERENAVGHAGKAEIVDSSARNLAGYAGKADIIDGRYS